MVPLGVVAVVVHHLLAAAVGVEVEVLLLQDSR